jgi:hypothetical protein
MWLTHIAHGRPQNIAHQQQSENNDICIALAAWRSGHRTRLRNTRPGFESRQGVRFLGKHSNAVFCNLLAYVICIACVWKKEIKALAQNYKKENNDMYACRDPNPDPLFQRRMQWPLLLPIEFHHFCLEPQSAKKLTRQSQRNLDGQQSIKYFSVDIWKRQEPWSLKYFGGSGSKRGKRLENWIWRRWIFSL